MIEGPVTTRLPASFLQLHRCAEIWLRPRAAALADSEQLLQPRFDVLADRVADEVVGAAQARRATARR